MPLYLAEDAVPSEDAGCTIRRCRMWYSADGAFVLAVEMPRTSRRSLCTSRALYSADGAFVPADEPLYQPKNFG
jgi:hypothetical protein